MSSSKMNETPPAVVTGSCARRHSKLWRLIGISVQAMVMIACSIGLFWFVGSYYAQHNRFPVYFHPDEEGKAQQIRQESRNFNHPQLMLEATIRLLDWRGVDSKLITNDEVVFAGRDMSAYFSAGTAVLLAWAGFCAAGWRGFVVGMIAGALCPALLAHSRFFKEEPSLCFGVASVVCAAAMMCRLRHWGWQMPLAILMGIAVALAASGKYAGVVMVIPAILAIVITNYRRWWFLPILLVLMAYSGWSSWQTINWRAVEDWDAFVRGFEREKEHAATEHMGVTMKMPTSFFADQMWDDAMPHIKLLATAAPFAWILSRKRRGVAKKPGDGSVLFPIWLGLTICIYTVAVSYSAIPFFRYIVPSSLLLNFFAALALIWLTDLIVNPLWRHAAIAAGIIGLAHLQAGRIADYNHQFAVDSRIELARWVRSTLPAGTRIAADGYTELNRGDATQTRADVDREMFVPSAGSIDDLKSRGVRYIAIAGTAYERFLNPHTQASEDSGRTFARRQRMYRTLFEQYPIVWQSRAANPMRTFTNPDIIVFQISSRFDDRNRQRPPRRNRWFW